MTSPVREEERRGDEVEGGRGAHKVPVGHVLHSGGLFIVILMIICLQVLLRLRQERRNDEKPTRREKNRTWGQATLQKGRERGAIKDLDYGHNYENVYDDDDDDEGIERGRRHSEKGRAALYRSKSCDRAGVRGAVRDQVSGYRELLEIVKVLTERKVHQHNAQVRNLSERLSSLGGETPASSRASCVTPTPSILQVRRSFLTILLNKLLKILLKKIPIFQSFASRTIPCVELRRDLTCARGQGGFFIYIFFSGILVKL